MSNEVSIHDRRMRKYPKIHSLGHVALKRLFNGDIEGTEKIDGSQFRIYYDKDDNLEVGTKNTTGVHVIARQKMFAPAVEYVKKIKPKLAAYLANYREINAFAEGTTSPLVAVELYLETLGDVKHNVIKYGRIPNNNLYLFGAILIGEKGFMNLDTERLITLANYLGIEPPNVIYSGAVQGEKDLDHLLKTESVLSNGNGVTIEGIVIKNYGETYPVNLVSTEKYVGFPLAGKWVNEEYKLENARVWDKIKTPIEKQLAEIYLTDNRFNNTLQHLVEQGVITFEKSNLQYLIPEFWDDLTKEKEDEIKDKLWQYHKLQLKRRADKFVVKSYLAHLKKKQFEGGKDENKS